MLSHITILALNLPLKLFCATFANADTRSLKSLRTLFDTYLDFILAKFKPNHMVQHVQNLEHLNKNLSFLNNLCQILDAILQVVPVAEAIV